MAAVNKSFGSVVLTALLITGAATFAALGEPDQQVTQEPAAASVMLILRGIANSENPQGQLDDSSALEYARRLGYRGEVLDVAGDPGADSEQVTMALDRIRQDETVTAIYGFSGGGYNARLIWEELTSAERERIGKVIVIGSPGVAETDFPESEDVLIEDDPPEGHMAGPEALLELLESESGGAGPQPKTTSRRE